MPRPSGRGRHLEQWALIGPRLGRILDAADQAGLTPYQAALDLARSRVEKARAERPLLADA